MSCLEPPMSCLRDGIDEGKRGEGRAPSPRFLIGTPFFFGEKKLKDGSNLVTQISKRPRNKYLPV